MMEYHSARQVFGGLNSAEGFLSFYSEYFTPCRQLTVLKGGPGTGKSKMMRSFAARAIREGEEPLLILCGSDPSSLDGVYLPKRQIGILDGTAPHTVDPSLPGIDGRIADLGRFWDEKALEENAETIRALSAYKKEQYAAVTRDFRMIALLHEERSGILSRVLDGEKMTAAVKRMLPAGNGKTDPRVRLTQLRAIGMKGDVLLPMPEYRERIEVTGQFGSGLLFTEAALKEARARRLDVFVSYHPILFSLPEILFFPQSGLLLSAIPSEKSDKVVRMTRFLERDDLSRVRLALRQNEKLIRVFQRSAERRFEKIAETHFSLEKVYGNAMDFARKERYEEEIVSSVFG